MARRDPVSDGPRRRRLLRAGLAALAGAAVTPARAEPAGAEAAPPAIPPRMRAPGAGIVGPSYGVPSPYERGIVREAGEKFAFPGAAWSYTPLQHLHGIITPNGLHYERHHAGVPAIDPDAHRLLVHGLVDRPMVFAMDDIVRLPAVSRTHFLECAGNSSFFWHPEKLDPAWTVQHTHGLLSCAEWTGVRVADVLDLVGVQPGAQWVLAEGADAAVMDRSIPLAKMLDDALLAYAQNGERLRPEQGYPLRLLLPGYEGNTNIKWLRRLKLGAAPFETREETSKYTELLPDGRGLQFFFVMEAKSVITQPSPGMHVPGPGPCEIRGLAWSGAGTIRKVDVSTDGGKTWHAAALQPPLLPKCLTRFRLPWNWDGAPALLQSRAEDDTGYVQPSREQLVAARGAIGHYHYNGIVTWRLAPDGSVRAAA